jgi:hypothetical protein
VGWVGVVDFEEYPGQGATELHCVGWCKLVGVGVDVAETIIYNGAGAAVALWGHSHWGDAKVW